MILRQTWLFFCSTCENQSLSLHTLKCIYVLTHIPGDGAHKVGTGLPDYSDTFQLNSHLLHRQYSYVAECSDGTQ